MDIYIYGSDAARNNHASIYPIHDHSQRRSLESLQERLLKYLNEPLDPTTPEVDLGWKPLVLCVCFRRGCVVYLSCVQRSIFFCSSRPLHQCASQNAKDSTVSHRTKLRCTTLTRTVYTNHCNLSAGLARCLNGIQNRRFDTVNTRVIDMTRLCAHLID